LIERQVKRKEGKEAHSYFHKRQDNHSHKTVGNILNEGEQDTKATQGGHTQGGVNNAEGLLCVGPWT
jgi:hypothetical protein